MSGGEGGAAGLAPDAAIALGIAATALPFTRTRAAAVEHWLRVLRLRGEAGAALQSLGVGEDLLQALPIVAGGGQLRDGASNDGGDRELPPTSPSPSPAADLGDPVAAVAERAGRIARRRAESAITTTDLLLAVIEAYGEDCDRVLRLHGTDRAELIQRLARGPRPVACGGQNS